MPFVRKKGIEGLVFVPDECPASEKKHDCQDCFFCQQCSEERCRACRREAACKKEKKKEGDPEKS